jgi:hypothetical protein
MSAPKENFGAVIRKAREAIAFRLVPAPLITLDAVKSQMRRPLSANSGKIPTTPMQKM